MVPRAYTSGQAVQTELKRLEAEIDRAAAHLWALTDAKLADIQTSLKELKG
ncbi:MAG: hypothetical protein Kow0063_19020 [Anaerolineae bacterium]